MLMISQDHVYFGPSYKVNVITGSALADPAFAKKAVTDLVTKQSGILTNSGGDFFGMSPFPLLTPPLTPHSMGKAPTYQPRRPRRLRP